MANAFNVPDVRGNSAGFAALALKYHPVYLQAVTDGTTDKGFEEWLQDYIQQQQQPQAQPAVMNNSLAQ